MKEREHQRAVVTEVTPPRMPLDRDTFLDGLKIPEARDIYQSLRKKLGT